MAVARVSQGASAWNDSTTPKTATVSWAAGDIIVIRGASEQGGVVLGTPTATGLTFTLQADEGSGIGTECDASIWSAVAGSAGSGVTVSLSASGSSGFFGFHWGVYSGASGATGGTGNTNESTTNLTTGTGDAVVMILADFAATNPFTQTPATGSGTATELVEGFFTQYSVGVVDWTGCTAGTNAYGYTAYTGLTAASAFLVLTAAAGATPVLDQTRYRWGNDDGTDAGHTFAAAENTPVTLAANDVRLLRIQVDETAGGADTLRPLVQWRRTDEPATEWRALNT